MKVFEKSSAMLRTVIISFLLITCLGLYATDPGEKAKAYVHLLEVNAEWKHHKEAAPDVIVSFQSEEERIKFHLQNVIDHLRKGTHSADRSALLDQLWDYAENQVFPTNTGHESRTPYFIDFKNTYCAVGYLMKESGNTDLAHKIRLEQNYDYIENIQTEGIPEWAEKYEFTLEELAWIQPTYQVTTKFFSVPGELNDEVQSMTRVRGVDDMFVFGNFDSVDGNESLGLATFDGNQLNTLTTPVQGQIETVTRFDNRLAVLGNLTVNSQSYSMVLLDGNAVEPVQVPDRPAARGLALNYNGSGGYDLVIEGDESNESELWRYNGSEDSWSLEMELNGIVKGFTYSQDGNIIYGSFNEVRTYEAGVLEATVATNNLVRISESIAYPVEGIASDTVLCALTFENVIYFGGSSTEGPILSYYTPEIGVQSLMMASETHPVKRSIRTIDVFDEGSLIIGGDFQIDVQTGIGYWGQNLGLYNPLNHITYALGNFSQPVNSVKKHLGRWYVGGAFEEEGLNYIARIEDFLEAPIEPIVITRVYPNPTVDLVTLRFTQGYDDVKNLKLYSDTGKLLMEDSFRAENRELNLEALRPGKYIITVVVNGVSSSSVIIKN